MIHLELTNDYVLNKISQKVLNKYRYNRQTRSLGLLIRLFNLGIKIIIIYIAGELLYIIFSQFKQLLYVFELINNISLSLD